MSDIGTQICQIHPTDPIADGRPLDYLLIDDGLGAGYDPFRIDDTGMLYVSGPLDYETQDFASPNRSFPIPLRIVITAVADPARNLPSYTEVINTFIRITNNSEDNVITEGSAIGHAWEGGALQLLIAPKIRAGVFTKYEVDLDNDGTFDSDLTFLHDLATTYGQTVGDHSRYYSNLNGALFSDLDKLALLNPTGPVVPGTYTAHYRVTTATGITFEHDFPIVVDNVPGEPLSPTARPGSMPLAGFAMGQQFKFNTTLDRSVSLGGASLVTLNVSANSTSPTALSGLEVDWGDGQPHTPLSGKQATITHLYEIEGNPIIRVFATDAPDVYVHDEELNLADQNPVIVSILGQLANQNGDGLFQANALDVFGDNIDDPNSYQWDLDGDNIYETTGKTVSISPNVDWADAPAASSTDLNYRAKLAVTDSQGRTRLAEFAYQATPDFLVGDHSIFTDIDFTQSSLPSVVNNGEHHFDPEIMLEILRLMRPDVYDYWTSSKSRGVVELINSTETLRGFLWWNRVNSIFTANGRSFNYIRRDHNLSEIEVAQEIIQAVEGGYFASDFKANKLLKGVDDFENADQMAQYWRWWRVQAGNTTAQGARLLLELYSIGFGCITTLNYFSAGILGDLLLP